MRTGRTSLWVAGLVVLCLGTIGLVVLRPGEVEVEPPPRGLATSPGSSRAEAASELLTKLSAALTTGTRAESVALAAHGDAQAKQTLSAIHHNVRALRIRDLSMRYVDENTGIPAATADGAWVADVEISWRLAGFGKAGHRVEVPLTFAARDTGVAFISAGSNEAGATPLWLLDKLAAKRGRRLLVMSTDSRDLESYAAMAGRALSDVNEVLPSWTGHLIVQVPSSADQLEQVLGAEDGAYAAIAALTTTVDGQHSTGAPAHILVNREVFGDLGSEGAQIVMSHEATHVALDAATSTMPMWLLEGFADYVALREVQLPFTRTASQIIGHVRESGPPRSLPDKRDFDAHNATLGAAYEAAWLAAHLIAERHGEQRLVELYRTIDSGTPMRTAFRAVLGIDLRAFEATWRGYLREVAA